MFAMTKRICLADYFLLFSAIIFFIFIFWINTESFHEKVSRLYTAHRNLILRDKIEEASQMLKQALPKGTKGPISPHWLPLINVANGYDQLHYYLRVLEAEPEREATYIAIANLISFAPEAFHTEIKASYLDDIKKIPGVNYEMLEKYNLIDQKIG